MVLSADPETMKVLSGLMNTLATAPEWPERVPLHAPVSPSHNLQCESRRCHLTVALSPGHICGPEM